MGVPFVIYADFKYFTTKIPSDIIRDSFKSYTLKYQKHIPSAFCYYIRYCNNKYKELIVYRGSDYDEKFCNFIEAEVKEIYDRFLKI